LNITNLNGFALTQDSQNNFVTPIELPDWPYVLGGPAGQGTIRVRPEDFSVYENLSFLPSGEGEHVFLQIEKSGENTEYVARCLARFAGVRQHDVSYAGLKDRHAVTTQWFSVWLPGKQAPDWSLIETDTMRVLQEVRHARKLKRGVLSGNRFKIVIRQWQGDKALTQSQLETLQKEGIANYFGEQRFGHGGQNVTKALAMFKGMKCKREQRSIYLSAARSYLFNCLLARRVAQNTWNQPLPGDSYVFDLSHTFFTMEQPDESIVQRLSAKQIHPAVFLWGKGMKMDDYLDPSLPSCLSELAQGLSDAGLEPEIRSLRINVESLCWQYLTENELELSFTLPAGSYATAVLREIIKQ
jgi:tRNA pseudouridine13 synthase